MKTWRKNRGEDVNGCCDDAMRRWLHRKSKQGKDTTRGRRIYLSDYVSYRNETQSHVNTYLFTWVTDFLNDLHCCWKCCKGEMRSPTWDMKMFRGLVCGGSAWSPLLAIIRWTPATLRACRQPQPITAKETRGKGLNTCRYKINSYDSCLHFICVVEKTCAQNKKYY